MTRGRDKGEGQSRSTRYYEEHMGKRENLVIDDDVEGCQTIKEVGEGLYAIDKGNTFLLKDAARVIEFNEGPTIRLHSLKTKPTTLNYLAKALGIKTAYPDSERWEKKSSFILPMAYALPRGERVMSGMVFSRLPCTEKCCEEEGVLVSAAGGTVIGVDDAIKNDSCIFIGCSQCRAFHSNLKKDVHDGPFLVRQIIRLGKLPQLMPKLMDTPRCTNSRVNLVVKGSGNKKCIGICPTSGRPTLVDDRNACVFSLKTLDNGNAIELRDPDNLDQVMTPDRESSKLSVKMMCNRESNFKTCFILVRNQQTFPEGECDYCLAVDEVEADGSRKRKYLNVEEKKAKAPKLVMNSDSSTMCLRLFIRESQ